LNPNPATAYTIKAITYTVPSATTPGEQYTVSVDPETKLMHCTCPARRQCWHQKAVIAGVAGKPRVRIQPHPVAASVTATTAIATARDARESYIAQAAGQVAPASELYGG
jgi:hypothetical protein